MNEISSAHSLRNAAGDGRGPAAVAIAPPSPIGNAYRSTGNPTRRLLISVAILLSIGTVILATTDALAGLTYAELVHALRRLPVSSLLLALAATAFSFAALIAREATALRYVGARVPAAALVIAGFCGSALGAAVGFGALTGAAVRYRIYGAVGVKAYDVARLVGFVFAGFVIGLAAVGGLAAEIKADGVAELTGFPPVAIRSAGVLALAAVAALLTFGVPHGLRLGGRLFVGPSRRLMALQVAFTAARLVGAAAALWVLLPPSSVGFFTFAAVFSAATALGGLSHLPGGAGVFDAVVFWALRDQASSESLIAALMAYRAIYYFSPLAISAIAFSAFEARVAIGPQRPSPDEKLLRAAARLAPTFLSVLAFTTGVMLIVSGATPTFGSRLAELSRLVPLWALETSSFLGSVVGVIFLFVAKGLLDRRDGAWRLAFALSLASLVFCVFKGLAIGEAAFLAVFATLLLATRPLFDRPTSMFDRPYTWSWFAAVGAIVAASFGILWFAFRQATDGFADLWWQFEFDAQAPRAARALLGASVVVALALRHLLRPPSGLLRAPDSADLQRAETIVANHPRGDAGMAFLGDKALIFSASASAFLMYGKHGRSWIALFDPIGTREEWPELMDRFVAVAREHGGRACFYQVRPENLPIYLDAGFTAMKLGEEAIVDLDRFTLKGGAASHLRYALKRGERDGLTFELLAPEEASAAFDDLAAISAQWMEDRHGDEKGFSVAAFEPAYLSRQSVGLLRERGKPVAFVSIMTTPRGEEATLGLMRSIPCGSPVAMEFLFARLIPSLAERGFSRFSLGVAPLAGVRPAALSSRWNRLAELIWRHGDRFYNFQGLRTFKNKFNPRWEPRYFVASGALGPFVALADAAALIAGGLQRARADA